MDGTTDVLLSVLAFTVVILVLGLLFGFFGYLYQRNQIPNQHLWLDLLDRHEWRTSYELRKAMLKRVGTEGPAVISTDLEKLEEADLIESREYDVENEEGETTVSEYRLTMAGWKEKLRRRYPKQSPTLPRTV